MSPPKETFMSRLRLPSQILSRTLLVAALGAGVAFSALAADPIARFAGGIGSQPLRALTPGVPATNDVNGTPPGGRPWVIANLSAQATTERIRVRGEGLLLGGGGTVGTNGGQTVRARLYCAGVPHDSVQTVPLDENGDFRIDSDYLANPPAVCTNPILLIINVPPPPATGSWFAAGIPKR
jgi:hypothetical protein